MAKKTIKPIIAAPKTVIQKPTGERIQNNKPKKSGNN